MAEFSDEKLLNTVRRLPKAQRPYAAVPTVSCEHHPASPYADWWVADVPQLDFTDNTVHHQVCVMPSKDHAVEWAQKTWRATWHLSEDAMIALVPAHTYHSPDPLDPDALDALMDTLPTGTIVTYTGSGDYPLPPPSRIEETGVTQHDREEWLSTLAGVKEELEYAGSVWDTDRPSSPQTIQAMVTPLPQTAEGEPGFLLWTVRETDLQRLYQHPEGQADTVQGVCPLRFTTRMQAAEAANQLGWGQTHDYGIDWTHLADISPKQYRALPDNKKAAYKLGHQLRQQLAHTTKFLDAQNLHMDAPCAGPFISQDAGDIESRWRVWYAQPGLYHSRIVWDRHPDHSDVSLDALRGRIPEAVLWPDSSHAWPHFNHAAQDAYQSESSVPSIPLSLLSAQFARQPGRLVLAQALNPQTQTSLMVGWLADPTTHWTVQAATAQGPQWQWQGHDLTDTRPLRLWGTAHTTQPTCPDWTHQPLPDTTYKALGDPATRQILAVYAQAPKTDTPVEMNPSWPDWAAQQRAQQQARYAPWAQEHGYTCEVRTLNWATAQADPTTPIFNDTVYPSTLHTTFAPLLKDLWHGYYPARTNTAKNPTPDIPPFLNSPPLSVIARRPFHDDRHPLTQDAIQSDTYLTTAMPDGALSSKPVAPEFTDTASAEPLTNDGTDVVMPMDRPQAVPRYRPRIDRTRTHISTGTVPRSGPARHR